jgi:glucosamine--fructose-6-phosphate aminotransferase (isomerizing)
MIKRVLKQDKGLQQLTTTISDNKSLLLMGRGYQCVFFSAPLL